MEVWENGQTSNFWKAASNSVASTVTATSTMVLIPRMHPDDQDTIDDIPLEVATRALSLRGKFLAHVVQRTVSGTGIRTSRPSPRWLRANCSRWRGPSGGIRTR